jgi:hypothetical protein
MGNRTRDLPVCSAMPQPLRHRVPPYVHRPEPQFRVWIFTVCSSGALGRLYPTIIVLYNTSGVLYFHTFRSWTKLDPCSGPKRFETK